MISALDSFIVYINTQLGGTPAVHWVRQDPTDDQAYLLKENALNISLLAVDQAGSVEELLVSLDLVGSDERTVLGWLKRIRDVMLQEQIVLEKDYEANPASPQSLQRLVSWSRDDVQFVTIHKDARFIHLNSTITLSHVRQ